MLSFRKTNDKPTEEAKEKKSVTKFFQEEPVFKVRINDETPFGALAPEFTVVIKHNTLAKDFDSAKARYESGNVKFKILDGDYLQVSILPTMAKFEEDDTAFRTLVGIPARYRMTTLELSKILEQYNGYLKNYNIQSAHSSNQNRYEGYSRPGSNHSH